MTTPTNTTNNPQTRTNTSAKAFALAILVAVYLAAGIAYAKVISHHDAAATAAYSTR